MIRYLYLLAFISFPGQASQKCTDSYDEFYEHMEFVFRALDQDMKIEETLPTGESREGSISYEKTLPYLMQFKFLWEGGNSGVFFIGGSPFDKTFFSIGSSYPEKIFSEQTFGCFDVNERELTFRSADNEEEEKAIFKFLEEGVITLTLYSQAQGGGWSQVGSAQKMTPK